MLQIRAEVYIRKYTIPYPRNIDHLQAACASGTQDRASCFFVL